MCIHGSLGQGLTLGAGPFAPDVTLYAEDTGNIVQLLGDIFTDAF